MENFLSLDSFGFRRTSVVVHSLGPRLAFLFLFRASPPTGQSPAGVGMRTLIVSPGHPRSGYPRIDASPEVRLGSFNAEREMALGPATRPDASAQFLVFVF